MELIRKSDKIKNISKTWNSHFYSNHSLDVIRIGNRLRDEKPDTEEKIINIIGNDSWTTNKCTECEVDCEVTVQLGEDLDYDSSTVRICFDCIEKSLYLFHETTDVMSNMIPSECEYDGKNYRILNIDMQGGYFTLQDAEAKKGNVQVLENIDILSCRPIKLK